MFRGRNATKHHAKFAHPQLECVFTIHRQSKKIPLITRA
jgi:hypothetical protein